MASLPELCPSQSAAAFPTTHPSGDSHVSPLGRLIRLCGGTGGDSVWRQLLVPAVLLVGYLTLGSLGFSAIERQPELLRQERTRVLLRGLASRFTCSDKENATALLVELLSILPAGATVQATGGGNLSLSIPTRWDFQGALFFSMTVITTIGYGNIAPSTGPGRGFCCLYAIVGIPLLATALGGLAARLRRVAERVRRLRCWGDSPVLAKIGSCVLFVLVGFGFYFVLPSLMFVQTENWEFGVAMYFCFVTLSTIGFGDLIAGQSAAPFPGYKVLISAWIYTGLIFVSGAIATVQSIMEKGADTIATVTMDSDAFSEQPSADMRLKLESADPSPNPNPSPTSTHDSTALSATAADLALQEFNESEWEVETVRPAEVTGQSTTRIRHAF